MALTAGPGLEHQHLYAGLRQPPGGEQPGDSGPNDDHISLLHHL
jgi:hypothetical protein